MKKFINLNNLTPLNKTVSENILTALTYWLISHINYLLFSTIGLVPMPIWPAAALAIVLSFYKGLKIAPGIALGSILANHLSLGAGLLFSSCIAVMNTIGPAAGAYIMKRKVTRYFRIKSIFDLAVCFSAAIILTPFMTALGGIGSKWMLGLLPLSEVPAAFGKWFLAHSLATLFFGFPMFTWLSGRNKPEINENESLDFKNIRMKTFALYSGIFLTLFIWFTDSIFRYLWFETGDTLFKTLFPIHRPESLLMRLLFYSIFFFTGIVTGNVLDYLKLQQQAIWKIAENLNTTLYSIGDGVIVTDKNGLITRINPVAENLTGWNAAEAVSKKIYEVFNIIDSFTGKKLINPVDKVFETGEIAGIASHSALISKNGMQHQISDSAAPIMDSEDKITGAVLVFRDITEDYKLRENLKSNEERLELALQGANDGIWDWDLTANKVHFDSRYYTMAGYEPGDFPSDFSEWEKRVHPDDITETKKTIEDCLTKAECSFTAEFRFLKKDMSWMWIRAKGKIVDFDDQHNPLRFIGTHSDISDLKKTEEALRESEERQRGIIESIADWIWEVDNSGKYIYCSDKVFDILGYHPEELIGKTPFDLIENNEMVLKKFNNAIKNKTEFKNLENWNISKTGEKVCLLTNGAPVLDKDGVLQGFIGVDVDITDQKKAENEKQKLESRLRQAQKMEAIGTLAGGIAHDFNNILSPIVGYSELLLEDLEENSQETDYVKQIFNATLRARDLVNQILSFSRQSEQENKPVIFQSILKEALKLLSSTIPSTIKIIPEYDCGDCIVMGDPTKLLQIIMNLATNSYHAMQETGGELKVSMSKTEIKSAPLGFDNFQSGHYALLKVSDTGCGIEKELLDRIFDPYFTTKERGKGTGLGLAVVRGIVRDCSGEINIYSEPGIGTEVHVYLPLNNEDSSEKNTYYEENVSGGNERILLIDDEESIVKLEKVMLERLGYKVTEKSQSTEALNLFADKPDDFDMVITDMTMPDMTGLQLIQKIRNYRPDIPAVICTGFSHQISEDNISELGIQGFIRKPIIRNNLAKTIRNIFDSI